MRSAGDRCTPEVCWLANLDYLMNSGPVTETTHSHGVTILRFWSVSAAWVFWFRVLQYFRVFHRALASSKDFLWGRYASKFSCRPDPVLVSCCTKCLSSWLLAGCLAMFASPRCQPDLLKHALWEGNPDSLLARYKWQSFVIKLQMPHPSSVTKFHCEEQVTQWEGIMEDHKEQEIGIVCSHTKVYLLQNWIYGSKGRCIESCYKQNC